MQSIFVFFSLCSVFHTCSFFQSYKKQVLISNYSFLYILKRQHIYQVLCFYSVSSNPVCLGTFFPLPQKHARPPAHSPWESSFQFKLAHVAQQILYNTIYYYNAHKKPSSKFHYSLELYSVCALPLSTVWPVAATLFHIRCGLYLKEFQFIFSQEGLRTQRTPDGWLHCSCQRLPLECCFP